ncbi:hypothetical protein V6N11_022595 [Hibiscus sabdariffa]|uniref:Uncharacterized protein n=1 Tax=Hibiscus sabdariffa TaxID=183260 RepID=A0ABR2TJN7_9ROSI
MFGSTKKGHFGIISLAKMILLNLVLLIGCLLREVGTGHVLNKCYRLASCIALLQFHLRMNLLVPIFHVRDGSTNSYSQRDRLMHPWVINRWKLADYDRLPLHKWFTCILSKSNDYIKDGEDKAASNTLVSTIQHMFHLDWDVRIRKIGLDYNRAVDVLARASRGTSMGEIIFHSTPRVVYDLLQEGF